MKQFMLIFALFLPLTTQAEVQLYGTIHSGIETSRVRTAQQSFSRTSLNDFDSHIGVHGSEPLSGQTRFIWQFSQDVPIARSDSLREHFRQRKEDSIFNH